MKNWNECTSGNMPENLLPITSKETNGHDFIDKYTEPVLVTDDLKKEVRECRRIHNCHPSNPCWFWEIKLNLNAPFRIRYWSQKETDLTEISKFEWKEKTCEDIIEDMRNMKKMLI